MAGILSGIAAATTATKKEDDKVVVVKDGFGGGKKATDNTTNKDHDTQKPKQVVSPPSTHPYRKHLNQPFYKAQLCCTMTNIQSEVELTLSSPHIVHKLNSS